MDNLLFSFNAVFPLILIVALGTFLKWIQILDDSFIDKCNKFCFLVAFPIQLFYNIYHIDFSRETDWRLLIFIVCSIVVMVTLLVWLVPKFIKDQDKHGAFIQGAYRSNFLLIGLPLARNLFGETGVAVASVALPIVVPVYNFLAVFVLTVFANNEDYKEKPKVSYVQLIVAILKNPLIIASVLGLIFSIINIPIPTFLNRAMGDVGGIATPLALILLGGQFSFSALHGRLKLAFIATLFRLIFLPIIIIGVAVLLGFKGVELSTILIIFASPSAISGFIMAKNMGNDSELAGQIIILTTLLSSISLFFWVLFLKLFKLF
ncbi:MAG: AEC family transporter [Firmicutes bacterium HGW-Firmicutes-7]|nr:MAG: AEC family transporter [Firmicutes bacterium HGW-Firmicutes-7]